MNKSKIKNLLKYFPESIKPYFIRFNENVVENKKIEDTCKLYLLYGETVILLKATKDTNSFDINHVLPLSHGSQIPICFDIKDDSSDKIVSFKILDDKNPPNKIINIKIASMKKNEILSLHFDYSVLVKNNDYKSLPSYVRIPAEIEFSENLKTWLVSTESIQANNIFIKLKALFLKTGNKNLIKLTERIVFSSCYRRPFLTILRTYIEEIPILHNLFLPNKYWTGLNDAVSYFLFGGLCGGKANYETALLRANHIPARVLTTTTMYYGKKKWMDAQHCIIEFYCPDYGWVTAMSGRIPYQPKNFIILRINYPEDENIAGNGLSYYGGTHPWFWINNENIQLYFPEKLINYGKLKGSGVPAVRGWIENKVTVTNAIAENVLSLTEKVWEQFICDTSKKFKGKEETIYRNEHLIQKKAIQFFKQSNIEKYIEHMNYLLDYRQLNDSGRGH